MFYPRVYPSGYDISIQVLLVYKEGIPRVLIERLGVSLQYLVLTKFQRVHLQNLTKKVLKYQNPTRQNLKSLFNYKKIENGEERPD